MSCVKSVAFDCSDDIATVHLFYFVAFLSHSLRPNASQAILAWEDSCFLVLWEAFAFATLVEETVVSHR